MQGRISNHIEALVRLRGFHIEYAAVDNDIESVFEVVDCRVLLDFNDLYVGQESLLNCSELVLLDNLGA